MKIAFISNLVEPTGGDRILYHHVTGLRNRGHKIDAYFSGWIESYKDNMEGWNSFDAGEIIEYKPNKLNKHDFTKYDVIVGNGLHGASMVLQINHPNKVWFCQNFDPYVFGPSREIDDIYRGFDKYLMYCHDLKKIIEHYYGKKRVTFCNNGLEYKKFKPFQKQGLRNSKRVCFMVAYYRVYKGIQFANEIFGELRDRGYTTVEINATTGPLNNTMEFYHNPSFDNKSKLVYGCDVSIHPSIFETWGLVPMESMALGTPVIGVDSRGIMEYANPKNSIIVKERNVGLVCDAIQKLCSDRKGYCAYQRNGIDTAIKHDWKRVMPEIEGSYLSLIENA